MSRESDLHKLVSDAREARQREQEFFVVKLKTSVWSAPGRGEIEQWSEGLAAVESAGWTLSHWSTAADSGGNVSAYPVFRRHSPGNRPPDADPDDPTVFESGHA